MHFLLQSLFEFFQVFFNVVYPVNFSIMFSLFPYLTLKLFCFLCIPLLVCIHAFPHFLIFEFSFIAVECPDLSVIIDPDWVSFCIPFLKVPSNLSLRAVFVLMAVWLFFFGQTYSCVFPLSWYFSCYWDLIYVSSLFSHLYIILFIIHLSSCVSVYPMVFGLLLLVISIRLGC